MFSPYELYIGLRYTRARRRTRLISFIAAISVLGILIGIMALITILSVMNGFEKEVRDRILGMASHITISNFGEPMQNWPALSRLVELHPRVEASAPYISAEGMLTRNSRSHGVLVRGVVPKLESTVSDLADKLILGTMDSLVDGEFRILLGVQLAQQLGATIGDKVTLVVPQASVTPAGLLPRLRRFTVTGIFKVDVFEYDNILALVHMGDAAKLFRLGDGVTGIRVQTDDLYGALRVRVELQDQLGDRVYLQDWSDMNKNWFSAVQMEKRIMFIVVSLVLLVAAFNIVATLVMVVRDKEADIAILRTLGATPRSIMIIFIIQGTFIGVLGTALGAGFGVLLASNVEMLVASIEQMFNIRFLAPNVYYISELPSDVRLSDVVKVSLVAFGMCVLATIYPAWRAAHTPPAQALRYE